MSVLTAVIGADTSGLKQAIESAKSTLHEYSQTAKQTGQDVAASINVTKEQTAAYQRVVKSLEKVNSGTLSTSASQKVLENSVKELKIQWANMSDSARNSDIGQSMSQTMQSAGQSLNTLKEQIKQVNAEMGSMGGAESVKGKLKQTTKQLIDLTAKYRAMSAAEKESAAGRELASKMTAIREEAGSLKDTVGDVNQEITALASDTPNLDVFNSALGLSADMLSTYSSLLAKVTGDEDSLKDAIATVMTVQSAANMMTKLTNALQSSSVIMLKVRSIQEAAAATAISIRSAAEGKGVIATKAAAVAQALFNKVAYANPYVLLAMAIVGVTAALATFVNWSGKSKKAQEEENKAKERAKAINEEYYSTLNSELTDSATKYQSLQTQYAALKTQSEKVKWIKDNEDAFHSLGVEVNNVSDADNFLINNTTAVKKAFMQRAKAAALAAKAAKVYADALNSIPEVGSKVDKDELAKWGMTSKGRADVNKGFMRFDYLYEFTEADHDAALRQAMAQADKDIEKIYDEIADTQERERKELKAANVKAHNTNKKKTTTTTTTGNNNTTPKAQQGSTKQISEEIQKKTTLLEATVDPKKKEQLQKQIDELTEKKWQIEFDFKYPKQSLTKLDALLQHKVVQIKYETDDKKRQQILKDLQELVYKRHQIKLSIDEPKKQLEAVNQELQRAKALVGIELSDKDKQRLRADMAAIQSDIDNKTALLHTELHPADKRKLENELKQLEIEKRLIKVQLDPNTTSALEQYINRLTGDKKDIEFMLKYPEDALNQVIQDIENTNAEFELDLDDRSLEQINRKLGELEEKKRIITVMIEYNNESLGAIENLISSKQAELKVVTSKEDRRRIQREIDELTNRKNEIEFDFKYPEGTLARLDAQISNKQAEYKVALDDESRRKIKAELDALEQERHVIDIKVNPIVDNDTITDFERELEKHDTEMHVKVVQDTVQGKMMTKPQRAESNVENLKSELEFNQNILASYAKQYDSLKQKKALGIQLNANEQALCDYLDEAKSKTDNLTEAFKQASAESMKIGAKARFKEAISNGVKGTIDALGNMNGAVVNTSSTWTNLADNWNDMSPFEKVTGGIDAVVSTLQNMIGIYESVNEVIELFSAISDAATAKKVAGAAAEGAAVTGEAAVETAATQTKIANDAAEQTSNMATVASDQAASISGATKAGASLPFPANIAAIAAGIAAVIAAFSMIASFAGGGVIDGATTIGDYNLAKVNKGEMILNGSQQATLFRLLDGQLSPTQVGMNGNGGGKVEFMIKGSNLVGTFRNHNKKVSKI